jgi:hypothetical protein
MLKLMQEQLDFVKFISGQLDSAGIPYMLTGSVVLAAYTEPRMTRDIDLVIECRPDDAATIVQLFESACYVNAQRVRDAIVNHSMFNVIHQQWIVKADFIIRKDDPYRKVEFERRRRQEIDGVLVWITAPEDLILSKLAWAKESVSALQIEDVRILVESLRDLHWDYIDKWAVHLGVEAMLKELRSS